LVQLVEALDRILEILVVLKYRLIVLGALAGADQSPSIPTAVRDIETSYEALRLAELARASATVHIADKLELDPMPRLDEIAQRSSAGWSEVLVDRRHELLETVARIQGIADTVGAAMGRRAALADEALAFLRTNSGSTYGRAVMRGGALVDGAL
jgi:hypothetical protein